ncbi:hypothetical protein TNCV_4043241 [Trichonephila clavipes]|nr:hypothetical protein TNCV_4043241 [Trichonephila clavipes]
MNDHRSYCRQLAACWSTGVLMSASSMSAAQWIVCKGAFIQDPPHGKPSTATSAMGFPIQLLPLPAYSLDMSPIEHVWDLVWWRLARDPHPAAIWNSLPQADIQNLFDSMPCCIAALIAAHGGYTKY